MILLGFGNPNLMGLLHLFLPWLLYPRICFQVHLLVLQTPPQPLYEQVICVPSLAIPAHLDPVLLHKAVKAWQMNYAHLYQSSIEVARYETLNIIQVLIQTEGL
jgi:hypothetical protein